MTSAYHRNRLKSLNAELPEDFEAKLVPDEGRIFYVNHKNQASSWLPPRENWDPGNTGLPYGWEAAVDRNKKCYFINHVENYTTRDDPRDDPDYVEPPKPREVELQRDPLKGFGFVAGSEKPVVVRFVTEGGPSVDKLMPGDQLIKINGQDVKKAPREFVIDLVRSCKQTISLTVCQPYTDNKETWLRMLRELLDPEEEPQGQQSARKSALLTAAKKDRLKKNPSRVRFAEEIIVNGASVPSNSPEESYVPFMPNVLKVFLENGQTKSFKYDSKTTVKDVVNSLQEKLNINTIHHFNLVLHNTRSHMPGRMTLLQDNETVSEIASRPGARHFRCMFRVTYVPKDSYDLLKQDPIAFEYFYMQCVNDVLNDRLNNELKPDTILRLSALHIQQHAMSNNMTGKINIKSVEKEFGLEKFVPISVRENMRVKDLRKVLAQSLKLNQSLTAPGQKQLTALQAKLHYLKIISELKTFGSRVFMVTLLDKKTEAMVLVGPKAGISLVTNVRFYTLSMLADFIEIQNIKVAKEKDNMMRVELAVRGDEPGTLNLGLLKEDAVNFVCMVDGYYKIFVDPGNSLVHKNAGRQSDDPEVPAFESKHTVMAAPWSYPEDIVSMVIEEDEGSSPENERIVDLSRGPPAYEGNEEFISKLKQDLGIKSEKTSLDSLSETKEDSSSSVSDRVTSPSKITSPQPVKTVITIESRGRSPIQEKLPVNGTKGEPDSVNSSPTSVTPLIEQKSPQVIVQPKRRRRSPTPDARKFRKQNPSFNDEDNEMDTNTNSAEYLNSAKSRIKEIEKNSSSGNKFVSRHPEYMNLSTFKQDTKKVENGENSSDTDSGVGGEADKTGQVISDVLQHKLVEDGEEEAEEEEDDMGGATDQRGVELRQYESGRSELSLQSELHLDLSSLTEPSFLATSSDQGSIESTSFVGPFDSDMLPQEVVSAAYDPRMFSNHEIYIDPDIIDLTLLPPYPPTAEELHDGHRPAIPPSPKSMGHHPPLLKTATSVMGYSPHDEEEEKPLLQKSASVGYCPDFLDEDIDAFIDKLTVQPPPSDGDTLGDAFDSNTNNQDVNITDNLAHSWNGPMKDNDDDELGFENMEMSKTIDLGSLAHDDPLHSLVIPPPPAESFAIDEIHIVPPVESVKDRRKKFEQTKGESKVIKSDKTSSSSVSRNGIGGEANGVITTSEQTTNTKDSKDTESPASVSEKLNDLLKSLSVMDEPVGNFRRTSSLRLGRAASLDFLNMPQKVDHKKEELVTGSVRLKPKVRPRLDLDRTHIGSSNGTVHVPLKVSSNDRLNTANKTSDPSAKLTDTATMPPAFQRAQSCEVLPTDKSLTDSDDNNMSESFASLKAKLQSYRDSLLNRSLRRKKQKETDQASLNGDGEEKKSPLTRSNSFSSLLRRSLRRSNSKRDSERSSSESREATGTDSKEDNKELSGNLSSRDRKIWNTLTATQRSTFRPNTASTTVQDDFYVDISQEGEYFQERLAPKPPIPACTPVDNKGETRKPKAGPMKALSSMFDDKPTQGVEEQKPHVKSNGTKSAKRPAPAIPVSVPPITPGTSTASGIVSPGSASPKVAPPLPTAPPRRRNTPDLSSPTHSLSGEHKSKDDSDLNTPVKSTVKASPYATVGKMWRPMSMSSSAYADSDIEETYKTYNNFNALRDMAEEMAPSSGSGVKVMPNGHIAGAKVVFSASSISKSGAQRKVVENSAASEKSFALLKEKVSASHTNSVKRILDTSYTSEDFVQATNDVDKLLTELKQTMESLKSSRIDKKPVQFNMCKDELQAQVRQFVTDAKLLVSNATQTKAKLAVNMNTSMHSLAKIFLHGQATMFMMEAVLQAQHMGSEVMRVANAYKSTLNAAHAAVGKPLSDPHMKYLMRQATSLASLLSTLLKSLKNLEQK